MLLNRKYSVNIYVYPCRFDMLCFSSQGPNNMKVQLGQDNELFGNDLLDFSNLANFCMNSGDRFNIGGYQEFSLKI